MTRKGGCWDVREVSLSVNFKFSLHGSNTVQVVCEKNVLDFMRRANLSRFVLEQGAVHPQLRASSFLLGVSLRSREPFFQDAKTASGRRLIGCTDWRGIELRAKARAVSLSPYSSTDQTYAGGHRFVILEPRPLHTYSSDSSPEAAAACFAAFLWTRRNPLAYCNS